jgi:signal transduction histidine kinase
MARMLTWYRDLRLRGKLLGAFGLVLLFTVLLGAIAYGGVLSERPESLRGLVLLMTVLTVGAGLGVAVLVAADLAGVAEQLEQAARQIEAGDLDHRIGLTRGDELGVTAAAFDRMAAQLAEADAEREQAEAGLRAANSELEQFAYTVSHDLKAPLVTIQGFAHRLDKDYGASLDDVGRRYLGRIEANATHLGDLIEDVLAFSRVGRVGVTPEALDLDELFRRTLDELHVMAESNGATVQLASPLPMVVASPTLLSQVLTNLLTNAVTYGAVPGAAPEIEVSCDDLGDLWRLSVRDHGPGIPVDQQEHLFRLFERLPGGKAVNPAGSGVGLATVRKAAVAMGGGAGVESAEGEGATFWVQFPKVPPGMAVEDVQGTLESASPDRGAPPGAGLSDERT